MRSNRASMPMATINSDRIAQVRARRSLVVRAAANVEQLRGARAAVEELIKVCIFNHQAAVTTALFGVITAASGDELCLCALHESSHVSTACRQTLAMNAAPAAAVQALQPCFGAFGVPRCWDI